MATTWQPYGCHRGVTVTTVVSLSLWTIVAMWESIVHRPPLRYIRQGVFTSTPQLQSLRLSSDYTCFTSFPPSSLSSTSCSLSLTSCSLSFCFYSLLLCFCLTTAVLLLLVLLGSTHCCVALAYCCVTLAHCSLSLTHCLYSLAHCFW